MSQPDPKGAGDYAGQSIPENYEQYFVPVIAKPLAADLIERAAIRPGEIVLDVACGTGVAARMTAERVGPSGKVVGTDANPGMLNVARSIDSPGAPIEWRQAPAEDLPFGDAMFDVVLCNLSLQFFNDKPAALREMRRVLKPEGRLVVNVPGEITRVFTIMAEALEKHIDPQMKQFVHEVFSLPDAGELERLMDEAGFQEIASASSTETFRLPPPEDFLWQYVYGTPLGQAMGGAGDESRAAMERDVVTGWQPFVEEESLVYEQPITVAAAVR